METVPLSSNNGSGTLVNGLDSISALPANTIIRLKIDSVNFSAFAIGFTDTVRLIDVEQWGTITWHTMNNAFANCYNLNISATDIPNLSNVTDMRFMFDNCSSLTGPNNINSWNTSNVTDISNMFFGARSFNQPIGNWNTGNVTAMKFLFYGASVFNQNIGNWNTNYVTTMHAMFFKALAFNQAIGNWNISQVTLMSNMLDSSSIDCHNYAATLKGWAANNATPNNLTLGAANMHYGTNALADRNILIGKSWTIRGDVADANACYATGIANATTSNIFTLSPIPTNGTIQLQCQQAGTFVLYNTLGQQLYSTTILGNNLINYTTLPTLPAGLYTYQFTSTAGAKAVGKLLVQ